MIELHNNIRSFLLGGGGEYQKTGFRRTTMNKFTPYPNIRVKSEYSWAALQNASHLTMFSE